MTNFRKITKVSFSVLLLSAMRASCYIGGSTKTTSSILQSDLPIDQNISSSVLPSSNGINSFEELAERFSDHFVNNVVSALQTDATSFLESKSETQFNFKEMAKEQATSLLKEVLKTSLEPVERTVSESVNPPNVTPDVSKYAKMGLKHLFKKAENFAGVSLPDDIWDVNDGEEEEEDEEGEEQEGEEEEEEEEK